MTDVMGAGAQVNAVEVVQTLHEALARFGVKGRSALDSAEGELRHTIDWLDQQYAHWSREVIRRQEDVNRAKADLSRVRWMHDGERVGGSEQEIMLARAREKLREAEEKVEAVRRWQRRLAEAVKEYDGPARKLAGILEADLGVALALLEKMSAALEAYVNLAPPPTAAAPTPAGKEQP